MSPSFFFFWGPELQITIQSGDRSVEATDGGMEMMARHRAAVAAMKVTSSKAAATGGCR